MTSSPVLDWGGLYPLSEAARAFEDLSGATFGWGDVFSLVDFVDRVRSDQLYFRGWIGVDEFTLLVTAGDDGLIAVLISVNGVSHYLLSPDRGRDEPITWASKWSGGAKGVCPDFWLVPRGHAEEAIRRFGEAGALSLDDGAVWQSESDASYVFDALAKRPRFRESRTFDNARPPRTDITAAEIWDDPYKRP
ncbi:MAG: hypothetical protein AAGC53_14265 [Actinomycetota bacterium]